jgi:hypothetical protein
LRVEDRGVNSKLAALLGLLAAVAAASFLGWNGRIAPPEGTFDVPQASEEVVSRSTTRMELPTPQLPRLEPVYKSTPTYCQVAFGPKGDERIWVVLAAPMLYVDLNADGDLTGAGEATAEAPVVLRLRSGECSLRHELSKGRISVLTFVDAAGRRWKAWGDERGPLRFAATPAAAPIVHFDGQLEMGFESRAAVLQDPDGSYHIHAGVGCYGRGPGSFAHLGIEFVPEMALSEAVVTYPTRNPSKSVGRVTVPLRQRC